MEKVTVCGPSLISDQMYGVLEQRIKKKTQKEKLENQFESLTKGLEEENKRRFEKEN